MKQVISEEEIDAAFRNTSFGSRNKRKLLEQGVLKKLNGYRSGFTLTIIMIDLGLITEKGTVTKKGKNFLFTAFYDYKNTG